MNYYHLGRITYSKMAAEETRDESDTLVAKPSLEEVARSIKKGERSVMAYWNLLSGEVPNCKKLIKEHNLKIIGTHRVYIRMAAGCYSRTKLDVVYSHPNALIQCSDYLSRYPNIKQIPVESTEKGIEIIKKIKHGMALGMKEAFDGLEILTEDAANSKENYTDFFIVEK
ncbi:MAG: prephenate dehydratase domain-containing protein [Nanoarchaeota archaeon]